MRTKTLLVAAAVGAISIASSLAQVYSVNAVGYVNLTLPANGPFAMIANPLNGTNNNLSTILPLPDSADGTVVYTFDVPSQNYASANFFGGFGWAPDLAVPPGEGFFIQVANTAGNTLNVTFVGEVPQGTLINNLAPSPAFSMKSSIVPQKARLGDEATSGTLGFPAEDGDVIYLFNIVSQQYDSYNYFGGYGWAPGDVAGPEIDVAAGFFVQKGAGTVKNAWTRTFSVNP